MEYAVISFHNRQILVKPGSKFAMLGELGKEGEVLSDAKVLLYKDQQVEVGTPYVTKKIDLKIVSLGKTEKVDIFKYKSKSRYRRKTGHRQGQTILEVVAQQAAAPVKAVKPKATKEK